MKSLSVLRNWMRWRLGWNIWLVKDEVVTGCDDREKYSTSVLGVQESDSWIHGICKVRRERIKQGEALLGCKRCSAGASVANCVRLGVSRERRSDCSTSPARAVRCPGAPGTNLRARSGRGDNVTPFQSANVPVPSSATVVRSPRAGSNW